MATLLNLGVLGADDSLLRAPRHLLPRSRLAASDARYSEAPVLLLQAPTGFGKTLLLAQWRREHLSRGTVMAWLTASERDDPRRCRPAPLRPYLAGRG